jgi:uncharacterized protein YbjT (DUF2867 family)
VPTILVTGSTGNIGAATVRSLAAVPGVTVRAAVHARPAEPQPDNVEMVEVDFDRPETVRDAAAGVDAVFMITPSVPTQVELAERVLNALAAARVPRLVRLSAIGADREDAPVFVREHTATEDQIAASGIPATFLRPNSFMTNFVQFHPPDPEGNIRLPWGDSGVSLIDARDVADVAAHVLTTDGHVGKGYTLTGPAAVSVDEVASAIAEATGRAIRYIAMSEEAMRQGLLGYGVPPAMVDGLMDLWATNRSGATAFVTNAVQELTGRPARSLAEFARDHAGAWQQA